MMSESRERSNAIHICEEKAVSGRPVPCEDKISYPQRRLKSQSMVGMDNVSDNHSRISTVVAKSQPPR